MNNDIDLSIFEKELDLIKNRKIRNFTEISLKRAYNGFFTDPASQNHHHKYTGGLVDHTKKAVYIGKLKSEMHGYESHYSDLLVSSLLLHDITKHVLSTDPMRTKFQTHPITVRSELWDLCKSLGVEDFNLIMGAIESHMGWFWCHTRTPETQLEIDVYECDYLASRDELTIPML